MAKMEAAAEADMEEHSMKRPAVQKLKFLAEIEGFLAQVCGGGGEEGGGDVFWPR